MSSTYLWYTTRATGIVSLILLTATVVLGILTAGRARSRLPGFARADIHRRISVLTVVFLGLHVLTTVLDTYVHINWLAIVVPFTSHYRAGWLALGTVGVDLFLCVAISSALRQHLPARTWRLVHWLAYLSWPVAVAHSLGMGTDMKLDWVLALLGACIATVFGSAAWRCWGARQEQANRPSTAIAPRPTLRRSVIDRTRAQAGAR